MDYIHEYLAYVQSDGQFLLAFSDERLFFGFTRLHLATDELP